MHFIAVAFVRAMLTCELNIRTQRRILKSQPKGERKTEKEKRAKENETSSDRRNIYLVTYFVDMRKLCDNSVIHI